LLAPRIDIEAKILIHQTVVRAAISARPISVPSAPTQGHAVVGLDTRKPRRNLALLEPAVADVRGRD
jgi:hypothetical protein